MPADFLVHEGLGEAGLIPLVVAVPTIADQINEEIFLELGAIREGKAGHLDTGLRIIGVGVDDGDFEALGQVAGVQRAAAIDWVGRVAQLVVGDDVDRAARVVA